MTLPFLFPFTFFRIDISLLGYMICLARIPRVLYFRYFILLCTLSLLLFRYLEAPGTFTRGSHEHMERNAMKKISVFLHRELHCLSVSNWPYPDILVRPFINSSLCSAWGYTNNNHVVLADVISSLTGPMPSPRFYYEPISYLAREHELYASIYNFYFDIYFDKYLSLIASWMTVQ